ncbi:MAG: arsenosugar biosynthesis radical SAM (seleno)protein ArsS [Cyclobacteriaceae bacterium]
MKSLVRQNSVFTDTEYQLDVLNGREEGFETKTTFGSKLSETDLFPLKPTKITIFQVNVGKMCNQVCQHCHVDAGPDRKEIMTKETMQLCLDAIDQSDVDTVDLTGGAPEMNPEFRWFVEELSKRDVHVLVRCNLTIILANPKYNDLPDFFAKYKIEVVSSLPAVTERRTDSQRGDGVFSKSIEALKMLNKVGYGMPNSDLKLNLVYNPTGAFLPGSQEALERDFKATLQRKFEISFNSLYTITNIPISRYLEYLVRTENYDTYMDTLIESYNATAAANVMCRNTISIGWDGYLFDCDFNQMLDLKVAVPGKKHLRDWDYDTLNQRNIIIDQHCFGCTAGAGSSCGGATS